MSNINSICASVVSSTFLAWGDLKARYSRSVIGPLWLVAGFAIFAIGLAIIWSKIFSEEINKIFPFFSVGLTIWMLISGIISQASTHYTENRNTILNINISEKKLTTLMMSGHVITFLHYYIFIIPLLIFFKVELNIHSLLSFLGFILVILNLYWISILLGYLGAKYRDIPPLINALLQPLFFITPIIFKPNMLGEFYWIINVNPFTHYINIVREPILGLEVNIPSWKFSLLSAIIGITFINLFSKINRKNLPFWIN